MTNLDSILKIRDITLPTEVRLVKAMVFPVVVYGCESWTVNKAERLRIDAFELWCWSQQLNTIGKGLNQTIPAPIRDVPSAVLAAPQDGVHVRVLFLPYNYKDRHCTPKALKKGSFLPFIPLFYCNPSGKLLTSRG